MISPLVPINISAENHNMKAQIWKCLQTKPKQNNAQLRGNKKAWRMTDWLISFVLNNRTHSE